MGIIKAAIEAVKGGLADQWEEVIKSEDMGGQTVFTEGVKFRKGQNVNGTVNTVSNGSIIHVQENQFMMLVDGGKVIDYSAEPGYYKVDNSSLPSFFNGDFGETLKEALNRVRFGGETPKEQKVFFINLQEIKDLPYGTKNPINYYDNFYDAELFMRAHGYYSVKICNPILFYSEVIPKNASHVEYKDISAQYTSEFMTALESAINNMSADGVRISQVRGKSGDMARYMRDALDEDWAQMRGIEIQSVSCEISYDDDSKKLINLRNEGAMLKNKDIQAGFVAKNFAEGVKAAGSNDAGAMTGFMGVGMGGTMFNNMMGAYNQQPAPQQAAPQQVAPQAGGWNCACGATNTGKFCSNCGQPQPAPAGSWICACGTTNTGKFCSNCGQPNPDAEWTCSCGTVNKGKFCGNCGQPRA